VIKVAGLGILHRLCNRPERAQVVPMFASTNIRKHEVQKKKAFVYEDL
jgi:hypothetical protein